LPEAEQIRFIAPYRAHYRQAYAYAVTHAGRQFADEVVADTFLVAWRRFAALPRNATLPWLLGVARNVVRERFREQARHQAITAEMRAWLREEELLVPDVADGVSERAAVLAGLARLSEQDLDLLTLVAWHGSTPSQAARLPDRTSRTQMPVPGHPLPRPDRTGPGQMGGPLEARVERLRDHLRRPYRSIHDQLTPPGQLHRTSDSPLNAFD
jgi:RNA polymerase sigma-70 factor (ECF subfamily)